MRKILISLGVIVFVGALAAGATGAFFSDTETSTGNTFTAGSIDLKVDSTQHYDGLVCQLVQNDGGHYLWVQDQVMGPNPTTRPELLGTPCDGTWLPANLGAQKFFDFTDIKPGDSGEDTVSLHLDSNPAWACIDVNLTKNDDVSSTEPELAAGDATNTDSIFDGELAQNIKFAAWLDQGAIPGFQNTPATPAVDPTEGDNIWQGSATEPLLFSNQSGPASDVLGGKTYTLADSTHGTPLSGGSTTYIGFAWCAGTQTIVGDTITCDGAAMGNNTQTDMMEASVAFRVEQSRNNAGFRCSPVTSPNSPDLHSLRLENETIVANEPWTIINDGTYGYLTWTGDGDTFNYTLSAQGLTANTNYDLIYYADGWPGNNPGAFIGTFLTDGAGAIASTTGNPDLHTSMPVSPDGNLSVGAKIWLVRSSDYNGGSLSTGPMTAWNPSQYLFEGNVYIHYVDPNN